MGSVTSGVASSSSDGPSDLSSLESTRCGSASILQYNLMPTLLHLGNVTTSGGLGFECLQPSLEVLGMLYISSSFSSSSSTVKVSCRTCQRSTQTFDSGGTMLAGVSLAFHSSQNVSRHSSALSHHKDLIMDVLIGYVLMGLTYLHLTLWLLSNVCCTDRFSSSVF